MNFTTLLKGMSMKKSKTNPNADLTAGMEINIQRPLMKSRAFLKAVFCLRPLNICGFTEGDRTDKRG